MLQLIGLLLTVARLKSFDHSKKSISLRT